MVVHKMSSWSVVPTISELISVLPDIASQTNLLQMWSHYLSRISYAFLPVTNVNVYKMFWTYGRFPEYTLIHSEMQCHIFGKHKQNTAVFEFTFLSKLPEFCNLSENFQGCFYAYKIIWQMKMENTIQSILKCFTTHTWRLLGNTSGPSFNNQMEWASSWQELFNMI